VSPMGPIGLLIGHLGGSLVSTLSSPLLARPSGTCSFLCLRLVRVQLFRLGPFGLHALFGARPKLLAGSQPTGHRPSGWEIITLRLSLVWPDEKVKTTTTIKTDTPPLSLANSHFLPDSISLWLPHHSVARPKPRERESTTKLASAAHLGPN